MGRILLKFGVKAVIVVRAEVTIRDSLATEAGPYIYRELINGNSIQQAFKQFKDHVKDSVPYLSYKCCCEHEHDDECPWILKKESANLTWDQVYVY